MRTSFELDGDDPPDGPRDRARPEGGVRRLSADGFRVLARGVPEIRSPRPAYSKDDERDLTLCGLRGLPRPAQGHRPGGDRRTPGATASRSRCSPATTNW